RSAVPTPRATWLLEGGLLDLATPAATASRYPRLSPEASKAIGVTMTHARAIAHQIAVWTLATNAMTAAAPMTHQRTGRGRSIVSFSGSPPAAVRRLAGRVADRHAHG